ncbi:MAG: luciferase [Acidobacteriota bacterium]|nr:luciferase [Acidobacteriota bacterium]
MQFDIFFSICQTEVDGYIPTETVMFQNFFDQLALADELGFGCAWLAETHLSCQIQKQNPGAVIPEFKGEIGLNTDVFQMAHKIFAMTKNMDVGSAILNIQCNGGPIARAESLRTALALHGLDSNEKRRLQIGFAAGRFPFSNHPYGVFPQNDWQKAAWPVMKSKVFQQATEIFLRLIRGDIFSSDEITEKYLERKDFRSDEDWEKVLNAYGQPTDTIVVPKFWQFRKIGVIPFDIRRELLWLTVGCHDAEGQDWANTFLPVGVFNLSITPGKQIEETHERMKKSFHPDGGPWKREYMPRTVLVFVDDSPGASEAEKNERAAKRANNALENYWKALQGTIDTGRIAHAVDNALVGSPEVVRAQMQERYNRGDRLMLWFDFSNHNSEEVKQNMRWFMEKVAPFVAR